MLHIETADGSRGRARSSSAMFPYDLVDGAVRWGEPSRIADYDLVDGAVRWGEPSRIADTVGWIPYALSKAVRMRSAFRGVPIEQVRLQAERCARLGHTLAVSPDDAERIGILPTER